MFRKQLFAAARLALPAILALLGRRRQGRRTGAKPGGGGKY